MPAVPTARVVSVPPDTPGGDRAGSSLELPARPRSPRWRERTKKGGLAQGQSIHTHGAGPLLGDTSDVRLHLPRTEEGLGIGATYTRRVRWPRLKRLSRSFGRLRHQDDLWIRRDTTGRSKSIGFRSPMTICRAGDDSRATAAALSCCQTVKSCAHCLSTLFFTGDTGECDPFIWLQIALPLCRRRDSHLGGRHQLNGFGVPLKSCRALSGEM